MSTISKIIIGIAIVYIATLLTMIDFNNLSWTDNREIYLRFLAAIFIVLIQFVNRKNRK